MDKSLVFDLIGEIAHFRTFYSNASSLTYGFPPRTVIIGIIAAILGLERDSYYEILSPKKCDISISIKTPIRKLMQTVNYIRTKSEDGFKTFKNSVEAYLHRKLNTYPISIELIFPVREYIKYRIYFATENEKIYNDLQYLLKGGKQKFPVYLGLSEFFAGIEFIGEFEVLQSNNKSVVSVIPENYFNIINFENSSGSSFAIEKMPFHFSIENNFRKITSIKKFIYEQNGKDVFLKNNGNVKCINGDNIIWM